MQNLLVNLRNELDAKGIKKTELANCLDVDPSVVTKIFKGDRQISLSCLMKILILLNKGKKSIEEAIVKYIGYAKHQKMRESMEYLTLVGEFDVLKVFIDKEKKSSRSENREYAFVYDVIRKRYTTKLTPKTYYNQIITKSKKVKTLEMEILTEILLCQAMYQSGDYRVLHQRLAAIEEKILEVKNKQIKNSLKMRLKEAIAVISLQRCLINNTRSVCLEILDNLKEDEAFSLLKVNAYLKIGESYIFEEGKYELAKKYLEKTLEVLGDPKYQGLKEKKWLVQCTLAFLKIYHWRDLDTLGKLHPAEAAFLKIKQGKCADAERLLLKLQKRNAELTDIQTFYLGLARNDKELIKKSLEMCEASGNIFYAQLPKIYLGLI
ncbi:AimR family lysis-lysogeny pheromone receptor [Bacillus sp. NPDC077411]|uniref:AimR family lysis-lysogeny pheromone receptor n=1 Tax=Bacillus sp. NPDC077411 TaxID=3363947 RepID=UPI0037CAC7A6